ncbi:Imm45 family immunity protein [Herbaspirillum huttiense F1]|uniref:Imm45 family immunity protein n=1 Tax=Herbaspirillum huttiense TaxID=863372 RepID=UPI002883C16B|nr:Imm45 family immunity protein [Herbaspirillum huttiense]MDT0356956.1 Imm45 family immunity protein [Herbaspirillum huttiense F1]
MNWLRLVDVTWEAIGSGTVFRMNSVSPYESLVDFMVVDIPGDERPFALVVSTGRKAGRILVKLPPDALWSEGHGLSLPWIVENWAKWIYPECPVEEVLILSNYEIDGAEEFPLIV